MSISTPLGEFPIAYIEEYSGNTLIGVCALFIALEVIFATLRFYARHLTTSGFGWDDALIPLALLTNVGLCILCIASTSDAGVGRHLAAVLLYNPTQLASWAKDLYALEWLYLTSVALPKISILCLFLRVFTNRGARLTCYVLIVVVVATWFSYVVAASLQCTPFSFQWDKTIPGGHCFDIEAYYKSTSVPNILTDLIIIALPIPTVVRLQATIVRKLGLLLVFLAGSVGVIGSCVRMSIFFGTDAFVDNTWASVPLMSWTIIEPGMYMIAACSLALRPLLHRFSPGESSSQRATTARIPTYTGASNGGSQGFRFNTKSSASGFIELESGNEYNSTKETGFTAQIDRPDHTYTPSTRYPPPEIP